MMDNQPDPRGRSRWILPALLAVPVLIVVKLWITHWLVTLLFWLALIFLLVLLIAIWRKGPSGVLGNRLLFAGIFFVILPLVLVTLFYTTLVNVLIAQYGTRLFQNLMDRQIEKIDRVSDYYLASLQEGRLPIQDFKSRLENIDLDFINFKILILKKTTEGEVILFCFPEELIAYRISSFTYKGYCMVDGAVHHGVFKSRGNHSILILFPLSDKYLEQISRINEFRVDFQATVENIEEPVTGAIPWEFSYRYLDFDEMVAGRSGKKTGRFYLYVNLREILKTLFSSQALYSHLFVRKFLLLVVIFFGILIILSFGMGWWMLRPVTGTRHMPEEPRNPLNSNAGGEMPGDPAGLLSADPECLDRGVQLATMPPSDYSGRWFSLSGANISKGGVSPYFFDYYHAGDTVTVAVTDYRSRTGTPVLVNAYLKGLLTVSGDTGWMKVRRIVKLNRDFHQKLEKINREDPNMLVIRWQENSLCRTEYAGIGEMEGLHYQGLNGEIRQVQIAQKYITGGLLHTSPGDVFLLYSGSLLGIRQGKHGVLDRKDLTGLLARHHDRSSREIKQGILDFILKISDNVSSWNDLNFVVVRFS